MEAQKYRERVGYMDEFSKRLKGMRLQRGFKRQSDLADRLGIAQQQISAYERGVAPKPEMLAKIADILQTTADYLVGRTDDPEPPLNLSGYERDMIAWSRGQGHALTTDDFLNYRLDRHPDNPKLIDPGQTPKLTSGSER